MKKRTIAREWLLLVACVLVGLTVLPVLLKAALGSEFRGVEFYRALIGARDWWLAWLMLMGPYIAVQFIRSIRWAVLTLRSEKRR